MNNYGLKGVGLVFFFTYKSGFSNRSFKPSPFFSTIGFASVGAARLFEYLPLQCDSQEFAVGKKTRKKLTVKNIWSLICC
jgi:hypothetical protein